MLTHVLQACLLIAVCSFALLAVELSDMLRAVVALLGMSIALGGLFWLMAAPYVALFQLLIYGGAIVALFIVTVTLTAAGAKQRASVRKDATWRAAVFVSIASILLILVLIRSRPFRLFGYAQHAVEFVEAFTATVDGDVSRFLWRHRTLDLIAQAFVLFSAALGCIALLRPGREGGRKR